MKIAIFTDTFYPSVNGIVTCILSLSKILAQKWESILIITPYHAGIEAFQHEGIEILTVKWIPALFYPDFKITFWLTLPFLRTLKAFRPDIIHFHTQFSIGLQAIISAKILKIPLIGTFHTYIADDTYLQLIGLWEIKIVGTLAWKFNNFFYKNCDLVITPSLNAKKELREHGLKTPIQILNNPLPYVEKNEKKYYLSQTTSENIVLYVGRLSREKNVDLCLKAIEVLVKKVPDAVLVIVGNGPMKTKLSKQVETLKIQKHVLFLWELRQKELFSSDIYARSKLFVSASASENQPMTLIEAMYFWLPIVWVEEKWVWELIEKNGLKSKINDFESLALHMQTILENPQLRSEYSKESLLISKRFNANEIATQLSDLYQKTIDHFQVAQQKDITV